MQYPGSFLREEQFMQNQRHDRFRKTPKTFNSAKKPQVLSNPAKEYFPLLGSRGSYSGRGIFPSWVEEDHTQEYSHVFEAWEALDPPKWEPILIRIQDFRVGGGVSV